MGQKKKREPSDFFEAWANYKVRVLSNLFNAIDSINDYEKCEMPPLTFNWKHDWPVTHCTLLEGYDSWADFLRVRSSEIKTFMETGILEFDPIPYIGNPSGPNLFEILKQDCKDIINIIENSSHIKDKIRFLYSIEQTISLMQSSWDKIEARYFLKWCRFPN